MGFFGEEHQDRTKYVPYEKEVKVTTNVREYRAPTDASVSLLREMEREIRADLLSQELVASEVMDFRLAIVQGKVSPYIAIVSFRLNDRGVCAEVEFDSRAYLESVSNKGNRKAFFEKFRERVALGIGLAIFDEIGDDTLREAFSGLAPFMERARNKV